VLLAGSYCCVRVPSVALFGQSVAALLFCLELVVHKKLLTHTHTRAKKAARKDILFSMTERSRLPGTRMIEAFVAGPNNT